MQRYGGALQARIGWVEPGKSKGYKGILVTYDGPGWMQICPTKVVRATC